MLTSAIVWDPSKGIDLGFFMIRYYSLMYLVAFTLGWYLMKNILERERMGQKELDAIFMYTVIAVLAGARLGHVIFYQPELFIEDPLSIILPARFVPEFEFTGFQGLASHGAAIGVILAMYFYSKKVVKKPILWTLDRVVIPVASGGVFIRIGNFINSEIIGKPTNSDYGVIFAQLGEDFARHPAQLYEAGCYVIVFIILMFLYWKTDKREKLGFIFGVFLVLLWSVRFFVEFLKEAQVENRATWALNTGQWLSIPFIIIGLYLIFRKPKTTSATA